MTQGRAASSQSSITGLKETSEELEMCLWNLGVRGADAGLMLDKALRRKTGIGSTTAKGKGLVSWVVDVNLMEENSTLTQK